jgi:hypothetical protein
LKPLKDALPENITYDEIRLVVAKLRREQSAAHALAQGDAIAIATDPIVAEDE